MPGKVLSDLEADPRVAWAAPIGFGDFFGTSPIVGTTTTLVKNLSSGVSEGAIFAREGEAVIGADVKLPMGSTVKPMHGTLGEGGHTHTELAYTVVGRSSRRAAPGTRRSSCRSAPSGTSTASATITTMATRTSMITIMRQAPTLRSRDHDKPATMASRRA